MQTFMWQEDLIGVAKFIYACLEKVSLGHGHHCSPVTLKHLVSRSGLKIFQPL